LPDWLEEEVEHKRWIVPGFVPHDGFVILSGQRKLALKTYTSRLLLASLVSGRVLGPFRPDRKYKALFVEEEGSHVENKDAWMAIFKTYDIAPNELGDLFWSFRQLVQLNSLEWRRNLVSFVRAHSIEVVLFDALFLMVAGDENDSSTMRDVLGTLQELRAAGCTVVLLAHLNDHRGADPSVDIDLQVRGSGLLKDSYDLHFAARRYDSSEKYIQWVVRRRGGIEARYRAHWDIRGPKLGAPDHAELKVWEQDETVDDSLNLLEMLAYDRIYSSKEIDELWQVGPKRARVIRKSLKDRSYLRVEGGGFVRVELEDAPPEAEVPPFLEDFEDDRLEVG
jgi:hypothetical protein